MGIKPADEAATTKPNTQSESRPNRFTNIGLAPLQRFARNTHNDNDKQAIPHELINYLALVDWTSRQIHPNKRGKVNVSEPSLLAQLNITADNWLEFSDHIEQDLQQAIGSSSHLKRYGVAANKKRTCVAWQSQNVITRHLLCSFNPPYSSQYFKITNGDAC